jgi:hypothetical protein
MNKESLDFEVNNICEAFGCFQKATTKISVKVGQLGTIPLELCIYCVKKFENDSHNSDLTQKITSKEKGSMRRMIEE